MKEHWERFLGYSHSGLVERVAGMLNSFDSNQNLLDVGCGKGNLEIVLSQKFHNVTGIDISKNAITYAKNRVPEYSYQIMDINKGLKFKDKKFDIVICIEVLEHIINPVFAIKEMMRVGKKVIITCPNGFWTELRPTTEGYKKVPNYVHFTEKQLRNVIRLFGGKILSFEYFTTEKYKFIKYLRNIYPRFLSSNFIVTINTENMSD